MSGPGIHYLISRSLPNEFRSSGDTTVNGVPLSQVIEQHPTHTAIGAQGPDFLFFLLSDIIGTISNSQTGRLTGKLVTKMLSASESIEQLNDQLLKTYPILEEAVQAKRSFDKALDNTIEKSQSLSALQRAKSAIDQLLGLMGSSVITGLKAVLADSLDVFSFMSHPIQVGEDLEAWWWFDVLHYRRSGQYATALLKRAQANNDQELMAYAAGYCSHVAADIVGHPYVNTIVRGPYRHHAQRHKVVENSHDVWAWKRFGFASGNLSRANQHLDIKAYLEDRFGPVQASDQLERISQGEFATSQLHLDYVFDPRFRMINGVPQPEEISLLPSLSKDIKLPRSIAQGIADTLEEVYGKGRTLDGHYPRIPNPEEIEAAYRLWYSWFRSSTSNGVLPPALSGHVPITESLSVDIEEIIKKGGEKVKETVEKVGDLVGNVGERIEDLFEGFKNFSFDGDFDPKALLNYFKEIGKAIIDTYTEVVAIIDEIFGSFIELAVDVFIAVLNIAYQKLYSLYLHLRKLLAASGLAFPVQSMLEEARFKHMVSPDGVADAAGKRLSDVSVKNIYPALALGRFEIEVDVPGISFSKELSFMKEESHLIYPPTKEEAPGKGNANGVIPGPDIYALKQPDFYMHQAGPIDQETFRQFFQLGELIRENNPNNHEEISHLLERQTAALANPVLGNAQALTVALINMVFEGLIIPDVNLDGDRGMAFPSWIMSPHWYNILKRGDQPDHNNVGQVNILPE